MSEERATASLGEERCQGEPLTPGRIPEERATGSLGEERYQGEPLTPGGIPEERATGSLPLRRMRRLRKTAALRRMVAESKVSVEDLVAPLFVRDTGGPGGDSDEAVPVPSLPGVVQHTVGTLVAEARRLCSLGVPAVVLFPVVDPSKRDACGTLASSPNGVIQRALAEVREALGDSLVLVTDLCLDEFTDHGHCGLLRPDGTVDNDATVEAYAQVAISHALAGADFVAPSGMMDGQVGAIRRALDGEGLFETGILAYSAKYASALYGPFRDAVGVTIKGGGDRRTYQQDPANSREAVVEARLDVAEGADIVMVKPALAYLDIIASLRKDLAVPLAAYHVSGEYAMVHAAGMQGWLDAQAVMAEHLGAIKRAGADLILTYAAAWMAEQLQ